VGNCVGKIESVVIWNLWASIDLRSHCTRPRHCIRLHYRFPHRSPVASTSESPSMLLWCMYARNAIFASYFSLGYGWCEGPLHCFVATMWALKCSQFLTHRCLPCVRSCESPSWTERVRLSRVLLMQCCYEIGSSQESNNNGNKGSSMSPLKKA
jgi:hypothetical protein